MAMVIARSPNSWPSTSRMKTTGRKMATVVAVEANSAPHTCCAPFMEAVCESAPCSRWRTMFSSTTIAASITIPTAKASPASRVGAGIAAELEAADTYL